MNTRDIIADAIATDIHAKPEQAIEREFTHPVVGDPDAATSSISLGLHVDLTPAHVEALRAAGDTDIHIEGSADDLLDADLDTFVNSDVRDGTAFARGTFHAEGSGPGRHLVFVSALRVTAAVGDDLFGRMLDAHGSDKIVDRDGATITAVYNAWG